MAEIDPNIIIDISKTMSAIDERTRALQNADVQAQIQADHRHKNVMQAMENFVPRREIESEQKAIRNYAEELARGSREHCDTNREAVLVRVSAVEGSLNAIHTTAKSLRNWLVGLIGSGIVSGVGFLLTHLTNLKSLWPG